MITEQKQSLRALARKHLAALPRSRSRSAGRRIREHLERWLPWRGSETVCMFSALAAEPQILEPWPKEKKVILPRVSGGGLELHFVTGPGELVAGSFGIREPVAEAPGAACRADVILVPGLAFDSLGGRLGRGGGYYDKLLEGFEGVRVGVCHEVVVFPRIPMEAHDAGVDFLATPAGIISCGRQSRHRGLDA